MEGAERVHLGSGADGSAAGPVLPDVLADPCALPVAPLAMPEQVIETRFGPLRRLMHRLRHGNAASASMDAGA
ncbi:hypothetical protein SAMN05444398_107171 [Roseovarius pacificus]|uniref:Uncharacterized protein n=2 Tax=Roseovarius pacificus TaxID=337701 RepID=A0A1M7EQV3_9RHOB|nr:hypothetical protein GCM10011315_25060 [Roseovarius pacificus]SHL94060.1 hypothetical protein SAMN05444398_107171 [Roseovarius pacificus]